MREIKFRAWDIKEKRMIYWRLFDYKQWDHIPAQRLRAMQFTGLKDKNGKEIYEGDIIKIKDIIYKVDWSDSRCGWVVVTIEEEPMEFALTKGGMWENFIKFYKVIGNIYENPELLNPTNKE